MRGRLFIAAIAVVFAGEAAAETYDCRFPPYPQTDFAVTQIKAMINRDKFDTIARVSDALTKAYAKEWVKAEALLDSPAKISLGWKVANLPQDKMRSNHFNTAPTLEFRLSIFSKGLEASLHAVDLSSYGGHTFTLRGRCTSGK